MKPASRFTLSTSPPALARGKPRGITALRCRKRLPCWRIRYRPTGKELDTETGLYYFGARYLDPKTGRWISGDLAVSDYIPSAPVNDEAKKRNGNLPGMGGVFNVVNLHVYHYAGNNPVKLVDPDGRLFFIDDFIFSAIGNIAGWRNDDILSGTWHNFINSWAFIGSKLLPGSLIELGVSFQAGILLSLFLGPVGMAIGFLTPILNTVIGYGAIELFGGKVSTDGLTTNITTGSDWGAFCIGSVVVGDSDLYSKYLPHEQGHFMQSLILGPLYWLAVVLPSLTHADRYNKGKCNTCTGRGYDHFYTEKWAEEWKRR